MFQSSKIRHNLFPIIFLNNCLYFENIRYSNSAAPASTILVSFPNLLKKSSNGLVPRSHSTRADYKLLSGRQAQFRLWYFLLTQACEPGQGNLKRLFKTAVFKHFFFFFVSFLFLAWPLHVHNWSVFLF